jgi:6-pyruvoyltetrahydropterin/6-carboxytetrahydropterin synthase
MYSVSKTFSFCYGHRLLNDPGKCGGLHGHTAKAAVVIEADELDKLGMVCHFDRLKDKVGKWIEENLDHRMLLAEGDPLAKLLKDQGENVVILAGNPTAENIARMVFDETTAAGLPVSRVEIWESPTSKATFTQR